jgi:hypothetical protein
MAGHLCTALSETAAEKSLLFYYVVELTSTLGV